MTADTTGLIPLGQSRRSTAGVLRWIRRFEKFGPSGFSATAIAKMRRLNAKRAGRPMLTQCRKAGHLLPPAGTKYRGCVECRRLRFGARPWWIDVAGVRINLKAHDRYYRRTIAKSRARMLSAHPDKGGTTAKFIEARKRYERTLATEAVWYAKLGWTPPGKKAVSPR